jgi:type IV pilus assembly protein PilM
MADSKSITVLNLGSQRISGAIFSKAGGDLVLKKYDFVDMPGDPSVDVSRVSQIRLALVELADRLKIKKSAAWFAVSGHSVFTRFIKLPPVKSDRVAQIVEFEARQNVPFPINEVVWDYEIVSEGGGETEVVLVAMKSDALDEINAQVISAGIETTGVDVAPLALFNTFRYSYPDVEETSVLIDLGARSTNLVFVDQGKLFTRNILVGGASITAAIAKEFGVNFSQAEAQKISNGFVSQGGSVQEHSDPEIAALSKVIRNAATNLHTQIMRTITFYRTQNGGSPPKRVFLTGGGAFLSGMVGFMEEKLKLPVEIFNPLRGVQIDRSLNSDAAHADSPFMGELVGLALRAAGGTPSEVELVPTVVANARDAARRMPALLLAAACFWGALYAGVTYFQNTERVIQEELTIMSQKNDSLKALGSQIAALEATQSQWMTSSKQFEQAVSERSWWVRLLTELNNKFDNDLIWLTIVEPVKDGKSITPALMAQGESTTESKDEASAAEPVYSLKIQGLYRKNTEGEQIVYRYAAALAKSPWFDIADFEAKRADFVSAESGVEENRYAYTFNITLPLKQPLKFKN